MDLVSILTISMAVVIALSVYVLFGGMPTIGRSGRRRTARR